MMMSGYEIFEDQQELLDYSTAATHLVEALQDLEAVDGEVSLQDLPKEIQTELYGRYGLYTSLLQFVLLTEFPRSDSKTAVTVLAGRTSQLLLQQVFDTVVWATTQKQTSATELPGLKEVKALVDRPIRHRQVCEDSETTVHLEAFLKYSLKSEQINNKHHTVILDVERYNCTVGLLKLFCAKYEATMVPVRYREIPREFASLTDCKNAIALAVKVAEVIKRDRLIARLK